MHPVHEITRPTVLPAPTPLFRRLLDWLVEVDARYREARRIEGLTEERLRDVGLTRADFTRR
ncbi:hypothetical protein [Rubellimicrobium roseum]|uniref:DUF1127 domain-containing protein n=1 Tax=Rubellimicrobium roseum TaxID=687525 RepID=A0A5C4NBG9_9RHOB|nr:hypothetical protein [Rubellimicrobium roseum]TNC67538.1 hypothetical protein FHG71_15650 [Rubellimicrobium roseum]